METVVTIASLIYASPRYAEHLWGMLRRTTPELESGEAEFFFVANDASNEVLTFLRDKAIPHVVQNNPRLSEEELFELGIGAPEYIRRVYQGWNRAIREARTDCLVLLSSDHVLRQDWLSALYDKWHSGLALTALTVEPGPNVFNRSQGGGTGATRGDHGRTLQDFDVEGFERQARTLQQDRMTPGGAGQPTMFSRAALIHIGLYPEGNTHAGAFNRIRPSGYADRRLFHVLEENGVKHVTYHGVVAYHFHEGEMRESR